MWTTDGQKGFGKRSGSKVTHDVGICMSVKWTAPELITPGHLRCVLAVVIVTRTNRWLLRKIISSNCCNIFTKRVPDICELFLYLSYLCICLDKGTDNKHL